MTALTEHQAAVLVEVNEVGGTTREIADAIGIPVKSARAVLVRLKEQGYVVSDSYQLAVRKWFPTDAGEVLAAQAGDV